jgi:phage FluMu protein Com
MSLIKCQECGKEVSDKAFTCPHCGYPINSTYSLQTTDTGEYIEKSLLKTNKALVIISFVCVAILTFAFVIAQRNLFFLLLLPLFWFLIRYAEEATIVFVNILTNLREINQKMK